VKGKKGPDSLGSGRRPHDRSRPNRKITKIGKSLQSGASKQLNHYQRKNAASGEAPKTDSCLTWLAPLKKNWDRQGFRVSQTNQREIIARIRKSEATTSRIWATILLSLAARSRGGEYQGGAKKDRIGAKKNGSSRTFERTRSNKE